MSDRTPDNDDVFAERVARVLREPERFDDGFERSLVAAIRADRPIRRKLVPRARPLTPGWWATPKTLRLSPIAGLALAASLVAVTSIGLLKAIPSRMPSGTPTGVSSRSIAPTLAVAQTVHDTVTFVRFVFVGRAKSVSLVGDFNSWGGDPTPLSAAGANGAWTASVPVPNGRHEYAFIVDGKKWVPDQFAPTNPDDFNTKSSIITVGD